MKTNHDQTRSNLRAIIANVGDKKLQQSHGIPVKLSPLEDVIDGMMGNARINLGGETIETVFANWNSAKDAADVYADPATNPDARPLSKAELKQLDGYIADAKAVAIDYPETVRNLASAIENGNLDEALKLAESVGSRENIAEIANDHDITVPGQPDRSWGKLTNPDAPLPQDEVLHRLDQLCEGRFLAAGNSEMKTVGLGEIDHDSYGDPIKWEPGTSIHELERLGKGCAEVFIDVAREEGQIPLAKKKFGQNRPSRKAAGEKPAAATGLFAGSRHTETPDIDALASQESKLDRAELKAAQTARLDVEPEKPRSSGPDRE